MTMTIESRRSVWIDISTEAPAPLSSAELEAFENLDLVYRSLCAMLYNYVPQSGHPGGSVSSGRFVQAAIFDAMDYDMADPNGLNADLLSYAAGHKALGLYAISAIRNEITRIAAPQLLPAGINLQMRLEDLLGFRKNPRFPGPLFNQFQAKALDGHPTPVTPFVRLSTGASGVGFASSVGLGFAAMDAYPANPPKVHIVEGEGGMTPGRVAEAMASAATSSLGNVIVHLDWNQASIDSNQVTREGDKPGDYVQWNPCDLFAVNDWNVIFVPDGTDFQQIVGAQRRALALDNGQPTAIVYRTTKGWRYGIEGRASHGAGHKLCSPGFYEALRPLVETFGVELPTCDAQNPFCAFGAKAEAMEGCFWGALQAIRKVLEDNAALTQRFADRLLAARTRVAARPAAPATAGRLDALFAAAEAVDTPEALQLKPGSSITLRGQLGKVLHHLNTASGGALLATSADLMGSTSLDEAIKGFPTGFFNARTNAGSRLLSTGGICEDGMGGILSGIAGYGQHLGVGSSYAAFIAPLGHIAARLHAIGSHARQSTNPGPNVPFMLIMGHAGLKTGEDGPTHADPQPLQLLQENFPKGMAVTLTPWDPQEVWPLMSAALRSRPAFLAPFVTRPSEKVLDRAALGLAPASAAAQGVYRLYEAQGERSGTLVLQDSGVTYAFIEHTLPRLKALGIELDVYYVASAELFDLLPAERQREIFPEDRALEAMGITGFTLATMYRWVRSDLGRAATLHPFRNDHYLGSGPGEMVIHEAGLDGEGQVAAIQGYVEALARQRGVAVG